MKNNTATTTQLVLTKRNGSLVVELPSGNKYQFTKMLLDQDCNIYRSRLELITRNPFLKIIKNIKAGFRQGELKGIELKDIQIVTPLTTQEIRQNAQEIESILSKLSVKRLSLKNDRNYQEKLEDWRGEEKIVHKFLSDNFLEDLRVLSN